MLCVVIVWFDVEVLGKKSIEFLLDVDFEGLLVCFECELFKLCCDKLVEGI